jgi:ABC-2 type transport system ATP-binding protein
VREAGAPDAARMIEVEGLTKRYGATTAVDDLTFTARSGAITGFLGPNGAGKTTALKVIVGLAAATSGRARVDGRVGVSIEPCGAHPGRSARAHLRSLATLGDVSYARVDELLERVGLAGAAGRRVGKFSLGMRQRLGLAAALLEDPDVLVLDEPVNGLDPQGIRWLRALLREFAGAGRTVLLSSHMLSEAEQTIDDVIVINHGRLVRQSALADLGGSLEDVYFEATA